MEGSRSPLAPTTQDLGQTAVSGWAMSIVTRAGQLLRREEGRASRVQDVILLPGAAWALRPRLTKALWLQQAGK